MLIGFDGQYQRIISLMLMGFQDWQSVTMLDIASLNIERRQWPAWRSRYIIGAAHDIWLSYCKHRRTKPHAALSTRSAAYRARLQRGGPAHLLYWLAATSAADGVTAQFGSLDGASWSPAGMREVESNMMAPASINGPPAISTML